MSQLTNSAWVFIIGWGLLFMLAAVLAKRLPRDYRSRGRPSITTLGIVWAFSGVHFTLLVLAAIRSTWHFTLPAPLVLGGGILLTTVGSAICLGAVYAYRGSFMRLNGLDTTRLVTEGIYRWSRNPQAVGWTVVLLGVGLIRESGMVLLLAVFLWLATRLYLPVEEELLQRLYGDAYQQYRRRTHRYFGHPSAGSTS